MVRALTLVLLLGSFTDVRAKPQPPKPKRILERAKGPVSLELESVDLAAAQAVVLISGVARPPESRLFTFHDDENRHFIALDLHCAKAQSRAATAPPPISHTDKAAPPREFIRCTLDLPRPYLRAPILGLTAILRGNSVGAPSDQVIAKFQAAREKVAFPSSVASPPRDGGIP